MVVQPAELGFLKMQKMTLLSALAAMLADKGLVAEIKKLVNADFSLKSILSVVVTSSIDPSETKRVRQRLSIINPEAVKIFEELIDVSQQICRIDNPLIKY